MTPGDIVTVLDYLESGRLICIYPGPHEHEDYVTDWAIVEMPSGKIDVPLYRITSCRRPEETRARPSECGLDGVRIYLEPEEREI